jgi:predicted TIM-barrel fold metal-dependent hydrolase
MNDAHCHFFSTPFFAALGGQMKGAGATAPDQAAIARLGWEPPGSAVDLADRWIRELDRAGVSRAVMIASVPGDGPSVAAAVGRHPQRIVGFVMVDPTQPDAAANAAAGLDSGGLKGLCLFPTMHRYAIHDDRAAAVFEVASARPGTAVFVHCGVLTVGVRAKLGLPSRFEIRYGNPLDLQVMAAAFPDVPIIVPHFGAGLFREALMVADLCGNILFDTSSSNGWMKYHDGLTLDAVFRRALSIAGPDRVLFGSDSSFFPRGWVARVYDEQSAALDAIGVATAVREKIFGGNFDRLFPRPEIQSRAGPLVV